MPAVNPPKFDGVTPVDATSDTVTVTGSGGGPSAVNMTAGSYFIHLHTGAPADVGPGPGGQQLIEEFQRIVRTVHPATTVAVSDTTGRVSIENAHAVTALVLTWTDTLLRDYLGFTGASTTVAALTTSTGVNQHRNGWYPSLPPMEALGDPTLSGLVIPDSRITVAPTGRFVGTAYSERTIQQLTFETLPAAECVPTDSTINSYQQFGQRVLWNGRRFRYYRDRTDRDGTAGAGPFTYGCDEPTAKAGSTLLRRTQERWTARYNLTIGLHLFVSV